MNRFEKWKKKLLDTSLRNTLLNFKPGSKTIKITLDNLSALEDKLDSGTRFSLCSKQEIQEKLKATPIREQTLEDKLDSLKQEIQEKLKATPIREQTLDNTQIDINGENTAQDLFDKNKLLLDLNQTEPIREQTLGNTQIDINGENTAKDLFDKNKLLLDLNQTEPIREQTLDNTQIDINWEKIAKDLFDKNKLLLDLNQTDYKVKINKLYKENKVRVSETGDHRLFLAIGFLNYFDEKKGRELKAPLILVPVSLHRKNIKSPFYLQKYVSDSKFNITLLEFLKTSYNIRIPELEKELPRDQSGLDVTQIFNLVSKNIQSIKDPRWHVEQESCFLSLFSFKKILMYKDIETLDWSKMPKSLKYLNDPSQKKISDELTASFRDKDVRENTLDEKIDLDQLFSPIPYDSSQLQAIICASRKQDFILQGPPGTGKSQTITNIISQLLANGKKVLFVAEKLVALNVVKKRLEEVGLGQFCLELHSDKSKKSQISKQLCKNHTEMEEREESSSSFNKKCSNLKKKRLELNNYVKYINTKQDVGFSPFNALGTILKFNYLKDLKFQLKSHDQFNETQLEEIKELIKNIQTHIHNLNYKTYNSSLDGIKIDWTPSSEDELLKKCDSILKILDSLIPQFDSFFEKFSAPLTEFITHKDLKHFSKVLTCLNNKPKEYSIFFDKNFENIKSCFKDHLSDKKKIDQYESHLSVKYKNDLQLETIRNLEEEFKVASQKNILIRWFFQFNPLKKLRSLTVSNEKIQRKNFNNDICSIKQILIYKKKINESRLTGLNNSLWKGWDTNWNDLRTFIEWSDKFQNILDGFSNPYFYECSKELMLNYQGGDNNFKELFKHLSDSYSKLCNTLEDYKKSGIDFYLKDFINNKEWAVSLKNLCEKRKQDLNRLRDWLRYDECRSNLQTYKVFDSFIDFIEHEDSDLKDITTVFDYNFKKNWYDLLYQKTEIIKKHDGSTLNDVVAKIRELDKNVLDLSKKEIKSKIFDYMDNYMHTSNFQNLNILKRESQKKKRHKSIRTLCNDMPDLIQILTPCFLMSPLSIAQYLPMNTIQFDYVIFDEASQIPPWDAIGAMARAKNIIVVGDSKQLPPTSFFQSDSNEDYDEDEDYEALSSILEECEALSFPTLCLKFHYRSRHESLIAFSNKKYYDRKLITFPSNKILEHSSAIIYKQIPRDIYEVDTNTSQAEAHAIVEQITNWVQNDNFKHSIGIVTFNIKQQQVIEELMNNKRIEDSKLETHFTGDIEEPIIIKNLENIQGDERDIIIFSIGFGALPNQELKMNFGALNKLGGEKRLNVAITRAREKMYIYTSIDYTQIDLNRTQTQGMKDLKNFLEYAEKGPTHLSNYTNGSVGSYESPFEEAVAKVLRQRGWTVKPQIGVGKFRIDLGIQDPKKHGTYLAGIECDGATYHSSAISRDRDCVRQTQLENLGWKILRIWSTDWWINKEKEADKIDKILKSLTK